jgi:Ser/Thr protein kinase RdoA (MazF antagonist)
VLTAPELVAAGCRAGLLTQEDVLSGAVTVFDESRSNDVQLIAVNGTPIAYVKQRGRASLLDGDDAAGNERRALLSLAGLTLVPEVVLTTGPATWVRPMDGTVLTRLRRSVPDLARVCAAWGAALAALHLWRPAAGAPVSASLPWALAADRLPPSMAGASGAAAQRVLQAVRGEPELQRAAEHARMSWTTRHWIHGDAVAANVLVRAVEGPTPRIGFIDLELAGLGDPGWDVATALDSLTWMAPTWACPPEPLVEHFLEGYRTAGGPGRAHPALQAVRCVMTAWQIAVLEEHPASARQVTALLEQAREFAAGMASRGVA